MYNINFIKLVKMLLPIPLRMLKMQALLLWLTAPIRYINSLLISYRINALNELAHGSQLIYLEKYLNDRFDPSLRRIRVIDAAEGDYPFFRKFSEGQSVVMRTYVEGGGLILRNYDERYDYNDFIIEIDNTQGNLNPDLNELRACVNVRKLAGIKYDINVIIN